MKQKILITGGSGLLALNWALLTRHEFDVLLCQHDRLVSLSNVENTKCDLGSVKDFIGLLIKYRPKYVVHTAGFTDIDACEINPDLAEFVNVTLAANVAQACAEQEIPLAHISSDHLFSGDKSMLSEEAIVDPVNVYGRTKAKAEERVLAIYNQSLVIRTNFYGWGTSYRKSFSDFIIQNLRSLKPIQLFDDVMYCPIVIVELVKAIHELMSFNAHGIYHIVGDEKLSKFKFGEKVAEQFELSSDLINRSRLSEQQGFVKRPFNMSLSNEKICALLGRRIGSVESHLKILFEQEKIGQAVELSRL